MNIYRRVLNMTEENMRCHVMSRTSVSSEFLYLRVQYSCAWTIIWVHVFMKLFLCHCPLVFLPRNFHATPYPTQYHLLQTTPGPSLPTNIVCLTIIYRIQMMGVKYKVYSIGDSNCLPVPASGFDIDDGFILEEYPQGVQISCDITRHVRLVIIT